MPSEIRENSSKETCLVPYGTFLSLDENMDMLNMNVSELQDILECNEVVFWSSLFWPKSVTGKSLPQFLANYLEERSHLLSTIQRLTRMKDDDELRALLEEPHGEEQEEILSRLIYYICIRILSGPISDLSIEGKVPETLSSFNIHVLNGDSWNQLLSSPYNPIFPLLVFLDFLQVFGPTNQSHLQTLFSEQTAIPGSWMTAIQSGIQAATDKTKLLKRRFEKSKGKGKGRADDSLAQITNGINAISVTSPIQSAVDHMIWLTDFIETLANFVSISKSESCRAFLHHETLVELILSGYELSVYQFNEQFIHATSSPFLDKGQFEKIYANLDIMDEPPAVKEMLLNCRTLKRSIISIVENFLRNGFFNVLDSISDVSFADELVNSLCDFLIQLMDRCHLDGPVLILTNSPLFIDFALSFDLLHQIKSVQLHNQTHLHGKLDETRLEYLVMSLEHLLTFSGNSETHIWIKEMKEADDDDVNETANVSVSGLEEHAEVASDEQERVIAKMTQISAIQDLFPDLHTRFIEACLLEYKGDQEKIIMKIIEDNFPPHLQKLKSMAEVQVTAASAMQPAVVPAESATPPLVSTLNDDILKSRRNIYDGDQFDVFSGNTPDPSMVIDRRNERRKKVKDVKDNDFDSMNRQFIFSRNFDEYDDEYDDTYDSTDIKLAGTIDIHVGDEDADADRSHRSRNRQGSNTPQNDTTDTEAAPLELEQRRERYLVEIYQSAPMAFEVNQKCRGSKLRKEMREVTGWSHEQIEGWFKMLERSPKQREYLLQKYEWRGNKPLPQEPIPRLQDRNDSESAESTSTQEGSRPLRSSTTSRGRGEAHRGGSFGGSGRGSNPRGRGGSSRGGRGGSRGRGDRKNAHLKKMARGMNKPDF